MRGMEEKNKQHNNMSMKNIIFDFRTYGEKCTINLFFFWIIDNKIKREESQPTSMTILYRITTTQHSIKEWKQSYSTSFFSCVSLSKSSEFIARATCIFVCIYGAVYFSRYCCYYFFYFIFEKGLNTSIKTAQGRSQKFF